MEVKGCPMAPPWQPGGKQMPGWGLGSANWMFLGNMGDLGGWQCHESWNGSAQAKWWIHCWESQRCFWPHCLKEDLPTLFGFYYVLSLSHLVFSHPFFTPLGKLRFCLYYQRPFLLTVSYSPGLILNNLQTPIKNKNSGHPELMCIIFALMSLKYVHHKTKHKLLRGLELVLKQLENTNTLAR